MKPIAIAFAVLIVALIGGLVYDHKRTKRENEDDAEQREWDRAETRRWHRDSILDAEEKKRKEARARELIRELHANEAALSREEFRKFLVRRSIKLCPLCNGYGKCAPTDLEGCLGNGWRVEDLPK